MFNRPEKPLVFEIKHNSLEDGPGIRSVIFLKGCSLDCAWCHNPESKLPRSELFHDRSRCTGCLTCAAACPEKARKKGDPTLDEPPVVFDGKACTLCFLCVEVCPANALETVGREMSIEELVRHVVPYKTFFLVSGGGITVSGGEPTLFMDFLSSLLKRFKWEGFHTLIQTNGKFPIEDFERAILPFVDTIHMDMKIFHRDRHKHFCGDDNDIIRKNFLRLHRMSQSGPFDILPRTPLIPGITDSEENIRALAMFYQANGVIRTSLLKNNPLWIDKYGKFRLDPRLSKREAIGSLYDKDRFERLRSIYREHGVEVI